MPERTIRRRDNAPIRKRRPATTIPDVLFAVSAAGWAMAATLLVLSFGDSIEGEAGAALARIFAATLAVTGLVFFALGVLLLRDDRGRADHYVVPLLLGAAIGVAEALLITQTAGTLLPLPLFLFVFALRPVRALVTRLVRPRRAH